MEPSLDLFLQGVFSEHGLEKCFGWVTPGRVPLFFLHDFEGKSTEFWEECHSQIALLWLTIESLKIFWDFGKMRCISALGFSPGILHFLHRNPSDLSTKDGCKGVKFLFIFRLSV